jgi:hypothetical protein
MMVVAPISAAVVRARPRARTPLPGRWHDLEDLYSQ